MQRLIEALAASLDPVSLVRRAAEQMCLYTPAASGAAITLCDPAGADNLLFVAAHGSLSSQLGRVLRRAEAFQDIAMRSRRPEIVEDIFTDPRVPHTTRALAATLDVRSWIVIPLIHNDSVIGAMSVVAPEPAAFDDAAVAAITSLSRFVGALISSQTQLAGLFDALDAQQDGQRHETALTAKFVATLLYPEKIEGDAAQHRLDDLFEPGALQPVYQPIVDLGTRRTVAYEALSRFPEAPERNVQEWFAVALQAGRGVELEIHAAQTILAASRALPAELPVAINLSPFAAADPAAQDILLAEGRALCVELTEHEKFPPDLGEALAPLRGGGIDIAVDDAGAGYSTFIQILRLRPDIIKIDAEFTADVQADAARRVLTSAIVGLSREVGALTVAEAIETEAQLAALGRLGVQHGQGYHLGRPQPLP